MRDGEADVGVRFVDHPGLGVRAADGPCGQEQKEKVFHWSKFRLVKKCIYNGYDNSNFGKDVVMEEGGVENIFSQERYPGFPDGRGSGWSK